MYRDATLSVTLNREEKVSEEGGGGGGMGGTRTCGVRANRAARSSFFWARDF